MKTRKTLRTIIKILFIQLLIVLAFVMVDLYVFRGFYTSKIIINIRSHKIPSYDANRDYSSKLKVIKKNKNTYLITFKNNSLLPKYFVNYRNEKMTQKVTDTLFFFLPERKFIPCLRF